MLEDDFHGEGVDVSLGVIGFHVYLADVAHTDALGGQTSAPDGESRCKLLVLSRLHTSQGLSIHAMPFPQAKKTHAFRRRAGRMEIPRGGASCGRRSGSGPPPLAA